MTRDEAFLAGREGYVLRRLSRSRSIAEKLDELHERMASTASGARDAAPAAFGLLYESRDGRLCLFESASGHLTAVDSARFA